MIRSTGFAVAAGVGLLLAGSAVGQSVVEYSTTTAAGAKGAAASGQGISKSIGGILGNLNKTLDSAKKPDTAQTSSGPSRIITPSASLRANAGSASEAEIAPAKLLRPEQVRPGMGRSELVKKFGGPFMKASKVDGADFVETYYYQGADDIIVVTVREGKVSSISPPPAPVEAVESASAK